MPPSSARLFNAPLQLAKRGVTMKTVIAVVLALVLAAPSLAFAHGYHHHGGGYHHSYHHRGYHHHHSYGHHYGHYSHYRH
jgi:hypothetical protein